jgi:hypothetical protein
MSEGGDVREITGKRENKMEVGESRTKLVVRRRRDGGERAGLKQWSEGAT